MASLVELGPEMMVLVVCVPASTAPHHRAESLQHLVWDIQLPEHRGEVNTRLVLLHSVISQFVHFWRNVLRVQSEFNLTYP